MTCDLEMTAPGYKRDPFSIMDEACSLAPDAPVFGLFSGGHDSFVSSHLASQHPRFVGIVHVNTGIGIELSRVFVREMCRMFGWPLYEYKATELPTPQIYEEIVMKYGFPGPSQHSTMYSLLKERCLRRLKGDYARRRDIVLITGIRKQESVKRMGYAREIDKRGQWGWTAPTVDWSEEDCRSYMNAYNLPRNPVKDKLCISGECLCGAFARPGERLEIREHFPEIDDRLTRLEKCAVNTPCPKWGSGGPSYEKLQERKGQTSMFMPLCVGCGL